MALFYILVYLLHSKLLNLGIKIRGKIENLGNFRMILEYFSLGKGPFTGPWGRLEKFLLLYLKMSEMPWTISIFRVHVFSCKKIFILQNICTYIPKVCILSGFLFSWIFILNILDKFDGQYTDTQDSSIYSGFG